MPQASPVTLRRSFTSDNTAGAAPEVLHAMVAAAAGHAPPYGVDDCTTRVRERLSEVFERDVDVVAVSTGSAANALSLAVLAPPWGSVLCHRDSHINNDECGAPEFFTGGAKLVTLTGEDAKIDGDQLRAASRRKNGDVHTVQPSVVSITQATEAGAVYTSDEVGELTAIAGEAGLRVHVDGARFANAVTSLGCAPADLTWRTGVDLLSLGAIKNGAMTTDAIVVFDRPLTTQLAFRAKRAGQLSSKMRFHAAQLDAYLTDDLWLRNARHANTAAARLEQGLRTIPGVRVHSSAQANIVFATLPQHVIDRLLSEGYRFYHDRWEAGTVRFVTSFATATTDVDDLVESVRALSG